MAAADKGKGGGGIDVTAALGSLSGRAAGIGLVGGFSVGAGGFGAGADDAVLRLKNHMYALGQVGGDQGGQADAQIHHVAVLELLGNTLGDKALDLRLFHYRFPPSTMYLM